MELVASAIRDQDLNKAQTPEALARFAGEIPDAITAIWKGHPEGFLETLHRLIAGSGSAVSPLADLCRLLLIKSPKAALALLEDSLRASLAFLLVEGGSAKMADLPGERSGATVLELAYKLLTQCCNECNGRIEWYDALHPLVRRCIISNQKALATGDPHAYDLLVKMLVCVVSTRGQGRCFRPPDRLPLILEGRVYNANAMLFFAGTTRNISRTGCRFAVDDPNVSISSVVALVSASGGYSVEIDVGDSPWTLILRRAVAPEHDAPDERIVGFEFSEPLSDDRLGVLRKLAGDVLL
jgi:hypothetical protein